MATGLSSFVEGAIKGYSTVKGIKRQEALDKRDEERDERERQRFALEQTRAQREEAQAKAAEEAKQEAIGVMEDQKFGRGAFAKFADPAKVQAIQQTTQSVEQKGSRSYDQAEMQRLGVRPSPEAQSNSVTPQEENIFKSGGEGLYADQRAADNLKYQLIGNAMKKSLIAKGDFGRAIMVDRDVEKFKEEGYDFQRKKAAALIAANAPPEQVVPALQKVYQFIDDGKSIDAKRTTQDPKTGTYNLAVVDDKTGAVQMRPMDQQSLYASLKLLDPVKALEINMSTKRYEEERATAAANRKEDVSLQREKIGVERIGAIATRDLRAAQKTALEDQVKGADVRAKVESITKSFPNADRVLKLEESVGPDVEATKLSIQNDTVGRNIAVNLASLNPKTDPQVLIGAAKAAASGKLPAKKSDSKTGRSYFDYGGVQIFAD